MAGTRILDAFEATDLGTIYQVPRTMLEMDIAQQYRQTIVDALGQDFAVDLFGLSSWTKKPGLVTGRWLVAAQTESAVDTAIAAMLAAFRTTGRGKLWTRGADGTRQWAYAKVAQRPDTPVGWDKPFWVPVQSQWITFSNWLREAQATGTIVITASGQTFTINNPGNAYVKGAGGLVLRLRANTATGIINPQIVNNTTNEQCSSTTDSASANGELMWDFEKMQFRYSADDGASYSSDWANITIPAGQAGITLKPGDNTFTYTGGASQSLNLDYSFSPAYEF